MGVTMIKTKRCKETHLGIKVDHIERKTDFLKKIVKNIAPR